MSHQPYFTTVRLSRHATVVLTLVAMVLGGISNANAKAEPKGTITLTNRIVEMNGPVGFSMIKSAQKQFVKLNAQSSDPIWIRINSPGGSVDAGLVLIDTFRASKSPVYCLVESKAYSMAAITLLFCDRKYALEHATIMLHEASYGTMGDDPSNRSRLEFLTTYLDKMHAELAKRLGMTHDKYRAKIRDAWWLMADEAEKAGIVDAVVREIKYSKFALEHTEEKSTVTQRTKTQLLPAAITKEKIPKRRD
jgi:ATP-dependent Clp protease, protease subunit